MTTPVYCVVTLTQNYNPESGVRSEDEPIKHHRLPSRSIEGTISTTEGVIIPGVNSSDLLSYELYDESGVCIAMFSEADDFISFLFSQSGSFEIRFTTKNYIYVGYMVL
ncbi:MAG: hypothetical protein K2H75_00745 [Muribaculaceae bacterium]|nr:hypothetical protein [Muribaculaceae bacterium]